MGLTHEASRVAFSALINSTIKYVNKDREKLNEISRFIRTFYGR